MKLSPKNLRSFCLTLSQYQEITTAALRAISGNLYCVENFSTFSLGQVRQSITKSCRNLFLSEKKWWECCQGFSESSWLGETRQKHNFSSERFCLTLLKITVERIFCCFWVFVCAWHCLTCMLQNSFWRQHLRKKLEFSLWSRS